MTSFRVAVQGWRMGFTDRTKVGHTPKVGASLTFPGLLYIMPFESHYTELEPNLRQTHGE